MNTSLDDYLPQKLVKPASKIGDPLTKEDVIICQKLAIKISKFGRYGDFLGIFLYICSIYKRKKQLSFKLAIQKLRKYASLAGKRPIYQTDPKKYIDFLTLFYINFPKLL
ncbi:MAG: hypothetical protein HWN65_14325 [Candidatus Helarchaeota archaeon]|nr:hypothetical protein [Candidatus Helarchaeota archaeon]